jgi:hypothetical protein
MNNQFINLTRRAQDQAKAVPGFAGTPVRIVTSVDFDRRKRWQASAKYGNVKPYTYIDGDWEDSPEQALNSLLGRIAEKVTGKNAQLDS